MWVKTFIIVTKYFFCTFYSSRNPEKIITFHKNIKQHNCFQHAEWVRNLYASATVKYIFTVLHPFSVNSKRSNRDAATFPCKKYKLQKSLSQKEAVDLSACCLVGKFSGLWRRARGVCYSTEKRTGHGVEWDTRHVCLTRSITLPSVLLHCTTYCTTHPNTATVFHHSDERLVQNEYVLLIDCESIDLDFRMLQCIIKIYWFTVQWKLNEKTALTNEWIYILYIIQTFVITIFYFLNNTFIEQVCFNLSKMTRFVSNTCFFFSFIFIKESPPPPKWIKQQS